jgi:hypothetical protein
MLSSLDLLCNEGNESRREEMMRPAMRRLSAATAAADPKFGAARDKRREVTLHGQMPFIFILSVFHFAERTATDADGRVDRSALRSTGRRMEMKRRRNWAASEKDSIRLGGE